jgi:hypothetical protein
MWRYNKLIEKLSSFGVYMFIIAFTLSSVSTAVLALKWLFSVVGVI